MVYIGKDLDSIRLENKNIRQLFEEPNELQNRQEKFKGKLKDFGLHSQQIFLSLEKQHDKAITVLLMKIDAHC